MSREQAEALFSGPVERIVRRSRRNGSIHDRAQRLDLPVIAARLRELEKMAATLSVWHSDPERFHIERSELKTGIGAVAKQLEGKP